MASPKKQVARLERIELETVVALREHSFEGSGFAHPDILLTRIARHVFDSAPREHMINKTRGIHSTACRISGVDFVAEILRRQVKTQVDYFLDFRRITFGTRDFDCGNRCIWNGALFSNR